MPDVYRVRKKDPTIFGTIALNGSKSISNRVLIIRALSGQDFEIKNLSNAADTSKLESLLNSNQEILDAGPAGTTFRFLTAYLAFQNNTKILTGSERMKQRPIGILVDSLNQLGANIEYLEKEGFPPLKIHPPKKETPDASLEVPADISSQFISALLLIAPTLPKGLKIRLVGKVVSTPYIQMTLNIMRYFGISGIWDMREGTIEISPQNYRPRAFSVEADWSAASYYYTMVAFSEKAKLRLNGLFEDSVQGDAVLADIFQPLGVETEFDQEGITLTRTARYTGMLEQSYNNCPDLAQSLAVLCGGIGLPGIFRDLGTLKIKETDRIKALTTELEKVNVRFESLPKNLQSHTNDHAHAIRGKASKDAVIRFDTYEDHRMAMAFAPLAILLMEIFINEPEVVGKSYPNFWKDLEKIGFEVDDLTGFVN